MSKKILVVDDEPILVQLMESRLKASGYEVVISNDGQDGLAKARSEKPDLIILDLMLPKLDGYRLCSLLKLDDNYKDIPVLMLTARVHKKDKEKGLEAGADGYISKPFVAEHLLAEIKRLLNESPD